MKVAVVGNGNIGRVHLRVLREMGYSPIVCDIDPQRSEGGYQDVQKLLLRERPDVVHICTPHFLHADMVASALAAGANVLCEKPLCIRMEDVPKILAAEAGAKGILGVCLQNRYNASSRAAYEFLRGRTVVSASAMHAWHRDAQYYHADAWRGKWETEGGGVLINQAIHTVDLVQWLAGMPERLTALTAQFALGGAIEAEDTAMIRMTGRAVCTLYATTGGGQDMPPVLFFGTKEGDGVELLPDALRVNGTPVPLDRAGTMYGKPCYGASHRLLIEDFYRCVKAGEKFPIDGAEGAKSVKIVLAAYESRGKEIPLYV